MRLEPAIVELPNRLKLPYVAQGDPSGLPLLLLHGFAGSWRSFELVLSHLPRSVQALALTQRGHGDASHPEAGYRLHDFAGDVAAFLDALNLKAAVIAGHSMGGAVAQRFAIDFPQRTLGLVLMATRPALGDRPGVVEFWNATLSKLEDPVDPRFVRDFMAGMFARPVPEALFEAHLQEALKVPARVWRGTFKAGLDDDLSEELYKIKAPTLLIWGEEDKSVPQEVRKTMVTAIADSRFVLYPGAGHELTLEEPERLASDLVAFIEEQASGR